jgi:hypothetical protein
MLRSLQFWAKSVPMRIVFFTLACLLVGRVWCQSSTSIPSGWPHTPVHDTSVSFFDAQVNPAWLGVQPLRRAGVSAEKPFLLPGGHYLGGLQGQLGQFGIGLHGMWEQYGSWRSWRVEWMMGRALNSRMAIGAGIFMQQQRAWPLASSTQYGMRMGLRYQANASWQVAAVLNQRFAVGVKQTPQLQPEWLITVQSRMSELMRIEVQVMDRGFAALQTAVWIQLVPTSRFLFAGGIEWPSTAIQLMAQLTQRYGVLAFRIRHQPVLGSSPGTRFHLHTLLNK